MHEGCASPCANFGDVCNGNRRHEVVVLILVADTGDCLKLEVRITARLYVFEDKNRKIWKGLLYLSVIARRLQLFPFFRKREMDVLFFADGSKGSVGPIVQGFS